MTTTKIDWCDYTWNPIVGCAGGCPYCYAKRLNDRYKWLPDFAKPKFCPNRLTEPAKIKKPSIIFVCSMGDIFGITGAEVNTIIDAMAKYPQHIFMVLTKRPEEYRKYQWPKNVMLGVSYDGIKQYDEIFISVNNKTFASCEPLLGPTPTGNFGGDLVIIGAQTGPGAVKPKREWVDSIKHHNTFYKDNIVKQFTDLPHGNKQQIWGLFK
jgi:protein gp37